MKFSTAHALRAAALLFAVLALCVMPYAMTQKVPISFDDFHGYTGSVDYLKKVAAAHPETTELIEIGKSTKERSIYVLVISNMKTGITIDKLVPLRNMRSENVQNVKPMKPYQGKPGYWIDGGTHGNEFTGTEVCLYIIDKLVSGYGSDPEITGLIDENTFYICPIVNPDGVFNSVEAGISQRGNSMMTDDDADGRINEDGPDDLNGDKAITQFRYKDPKGAYVQHDRDPRVMVRLGPNETTDKQRWSVVTEDRDNDGDGKRGEDPERGIDLNRNYPEGWFRDDESQGGTGFYPSSAPETHAILEFFTNHTNIHMVQSFHTSGGFTYRPLARWPVNRVDPKDLAVFDRVMGAKYLELIGEEIPDAWKEQSPGQAAAQARPAQPARPPQAAAQPQARPAQAAAQPQARAGARPAAATPSGPRGWRHPYNDQQKRPYGYGVFLDWAYMQFGAWAVSTELWNWRKDTKGLPGYAGEEDRALWEIAYINFQEKLGGKRFVPWQPFKHPELGEGEIGGWVSTYGSSNAIPGETLLGVCETHWQFELFRAKLLPRLRITEANAKVIYSGTGGDVRLQQDADAYRIQAGKGTGKYKIVEVTATVENAGKLATHVARGAQLAGNREDAIWLLGDRDKLRFIQGSPWMSLGVIDGAMEIPGFSPESVPTESAEGQEPRRPGPMMPGGGPQMQRAPQETDRVERAGNKRNVTWLVAVEGDTPLKVVVTSQKGGTQVKELTIN